MTCKVLLMLALISSYPLQAAAQPNEQKQKLEISLGAMRVPSGSNFLSESRFRLMPVAVLGARWQPYHTDISVEYYFSESIFRNGLNLSVTQDSIFRISRIRFDAGMEYFKDKQLEQILDDGIFTMDGLYTRNYGVLLLGIGAGEKDKNNFRFYYIAGADQRQKFLRLLQDDKLFPDGEDRVNYCLQPVRGFRFKGRYILIRKLYLDASVTRTGPFMRNYERPMVAKKMLGQAQLGYSLTRWAKISLNASWSDDPRAIYPGERALSSSLTLRIK